MKTKKKLNAQNVLGLSLSNGIRLELGKQIQFRNKKCPTFGSKLLRDYLGGKKNTSMLNITEEDNLD